MENLTVPSLSVFICLFVRFGVLWIDLTPRLVGCVPRSVEKERHPPLRHQGIISGGNICVFENLAQTLVAVDAS